MYDREGAGFSGHFAVPQSPIMGNIALLRSAILEEIHGKKGRIA
jgi:hypothetical protein